jgi:hypothetical protein
VRDSPASLRSLPIDDDRPLQLASNRLLASNRFEVGFPRPWGYPPSQLGSLALDEDFPLHFAWNPPGASSRARARVLLPSWPRRSRSMKTTLFTSRGIRAGRLARGRGACRRHRSVRSRSTQTTILTSRGSALGRRLAAGEACLSVDLPRARPPAVTAPLARGRCRPSFWGRLAAGVPASSQLRSRWVDDKYLPRLAWKSHSFGLPYEGPPDV